MAATRGSRGGRNRRKACRIGHCCRDRRKKSPRPPRRSCGREEARPQAAHSGHRASVPSASSNQRRRQPQRRPPLPKAKRELLVSVDVSEQRVAVARGRPRRRGLPRAPRAPLDRRATSTSAPSTTSCRAWRPRSSRSASRRTASSTSTRSSRPELEGKRRGRKIQDLLKPRPGGPRPGGQGPDEVEGRAAHDRDLAARPLRRLRPARRRARRLAPARGRRAHRACSDILKALAVEEGGVIVRTAAEGASAEDIERDLVFLQKLWKSIEARRAKSKAPCARLPGGRAAAPRHRATSSPDDFERAARRRRPHVQAHRRLPEEDLAAHGRARHPLPREDAAVRGRRRRRGDQVDARPPRRPALRRLPRSSTTPRRSPSST